MNRRGAGVAFCALAAFLYAINFLAAVFWMSQLKDWNMPPGRLGTAYSAVGRDLQCFAIVALIPGVVCLVVAEIGEAKKKDNS